MEDRLSEIAGRLELDMSQAEEELVFSDMVDCVERYEQRLFSPDSGPAFGWSVDVRDRSTDESVLMQLNSWAGDVDVVLEVVAQDADGNSEIRWKRRIECRYKDSAFIFMHGL